MVKPKFKALALAIAMAGVGPAMLTAPVSAANIQEEVSTVPGKSISPQEEAVISSAGVKVLRHIAQARSDIHTKDMEAAKNELDQAEKLLNIIQQALPTTEVKDRIWVAKKHLEYENSQEVLPDLIPIYSSLDELVDVMPVDMAKKHLDEARKHLKSGDKEQARKSLEATDAALQYTEVDLPLHATRQLVAEARAALSKEKSDQADKALKSAEDSVVYLSVAIQQPLFTAKALLWKTVLDLNAKDQKMAKADLQGAIGYLKIASKSDQKPTQEVAGQLLGEARQLQKDLNGGKDVSMQVRNLWQRAEALADRSMEYMASGWARYRASSPFKADLIEAKLHVTNAGIDLFTGKDSGKANKELDAARKYLDKAADQAKKSKSDDAYQKRIAGFQKEAKGLSTDPSSAKQAQYSTLEQELGSMIRSL
jgi:hypothetical protein